MLSEIVTVSLVSAALTLMETASGAASDELEVGSGAAEVELDSVGGGLSWSAMALDGRSSCVGGPSREVVKPDERWSTCRKSEEGEPGSGGKSTGPRHAGHRPKTSSSFFCLPTLDPRQTRPDTEARQRSAGVKRSSESVGVQSVPVPRSSSLSVISAVRARWRLGSETASSDILGAVVTLVASG